MEVLKQEKKSRRQALEPGSRQSYKLESLAIGEYPSIAALEAEIREDQFSSEGEESELHRAIKFGNIALVRQLVCGKKWNGISNNLIKVKRAGIC